jgi:hypothetical protein
MQNTILSEKTHRFAMKRVQKTQKMQIENVKKSTSRQYQNAGQTLATVIVSSIFSIYEFICY